MPDLSRRQVLAGAAATAAADNLPVAAAIAKPGISFDDFLPRSKAWMPAQALQCGDLLWVNGVPRLILASHVSGEAPSDTLLSRRLYIDDEGRIVEERA